MSSLSQELSLLESRGLVRLTLESEKPIVRFKHALTREATYNSMLQARRAELHRAAAQTLSARNPDPDLDMALTIAEHWQRGSEDGIALATILPHTQRLIYTGRSISLTALLERLERENLEASQQHALDIAAADAHAARGEYELSRALYLGVLEHADQAALRLQVLYGLGVSEHHLGNSARSLEYYEQCLTLAKSIGDLTRQTQAHGGLGIGHWSLGNLVQAITHLEASREIAASLGEGFDLANAEYNLAGVLLDRGDAPAAIKAAERALELDEKLGNTLLAARTLHLLGACHYTQGNLDVAESFYERATRASREDGDLVGEALGLGNLAEIYSERGKYEKAIYTFQDAAHRLESLRHEYLIAFALTGLADAQTRLAQTTAEQAAIHTLLAEAEKNAQQALQIAGQIPSTERQAAAMRVHAEILIARGLHAQARHFAVDAIELLKQGGSALELERAQRTLDRLTAQSTIDTGDPANP
jgi:tetratricopeptide (TPR) repeat protein